MTKPVVPHTNQMTNLDELFDHITHIIASSNTDITEKDKRKAIQIFLCFDDYLLDNVPEYCGGTELGDIDFGNYAAGVLDELEGLK